MPVLLGDGDSMEGWCDWGGQPGVWGGVSLAVFEMAAELPVIKFLAVAVTLFDFVMLIDCVKRDDFALIEPSACKSFTDDCTIWENCSACWGVDTLCRRWVVDRKIRGVGIGNGVVLLVVGLLEVGARCWSRLRIH